MTPETGRCDALKTLKLGWFLEFPISEVTQCAGTGPFPWVEGR